MGLDIETKTERQRDRAFKLNTQDWKQKERKTEIAKDAWITQQGEKR